MEFNKHGLNTLQTYTTAKVAHDIKIKIICTTYMHIVYGIGIAFSDKNNEIEQTSVFQEGQGHEVEV
jgi:hypothetical protein